MSMVDEDQDAQFSEETLIEMDDKVSIKKGKKKRDTSSLRKAPNAPKRFKSSYICFFVAKQPLIKAELGDQAMVTSISKRSAEMWKALSTEERALWDEVAAKDKQRYMVEKAMYSGPWQVPWKRVKKDPSAPKRPMSAFLYFSQGKRSEIKKQNPDIKNTEVSRILGELWRNLSDEERFPHVNREKVDRDKYKIEIAAWRLENEGKVQAEQKAMEMQCAVIGGGSGMAVSESHMPGYLDPFVPQHTSMVNGYAFPTYQSPAFQVQAAPQYSFPTNGKQPVILGPNGTPYLNQPNANVQQDQQQGVRQPLPSLTTFDSTTGLNMIGHANHNFDFSDHMGGDGVM